MTRNPPLDLITGNDPMEQVEHPPDHYEEAIVPGIPTTMNITPTEPKRARPTIDDVVIMLMGVTGSGKSSLISLLTEQDVGIGHSLEACTSELAAYTYQPEAGPTVQLIDTPGFNDTNRSDAEILKDIALNLCQIYKKNVKLAGLIYLHRITDVRMQGSALKNLHMFQKLCGEGCLPNTVLATTMWGNLEKSGTDFKAGIERERTLVSDDRFWGRMVKGGGYVVRHDGSAESARDIVSYLLSQKGPVVLDIQREMVDQHKALDETAAGQFIQQEHMAVRQRYERDLAELQAEMEEAKKDKDVELAASIAAAIDAHNRENESRMAEANVERSSLKITHETLLKEKDRQYAQLREDSSNHGSSTIPRLDDQATAQAEAERLELEQEVAALQDDIERKEREHRQSVAKLRQERRLKAENEQKMAQTLRAQERLWELQRRHMEAQKMQVEESKRQLEERLFRERQTGRMIERDFRDYRDEHPPKKRGGGPLGFLASLLGL